jgi:hypothetical protein
MECTICGDPANEEDGQVIKACPCTMGTVHRPCLDTWRCNPLYPDRFDKCGICKFAYVLRRNPMDEVKLKQMQRYIAMHVGGLCGVLMVPVGYVSNNSYANCKSFDDFMLKMGAGLFPLALVLTCVRFYFVRHLDFLRNAGDRNDDPYWFFWFSARTIIDTVFWYKGMAVSWAERKWQVRQSEVVDITAQ